MRLINTRTLELHEFSGENVPPYAILSHVWGAEEVTFQDWQDRHLAASKQGFSKINNACSQSLSQNLEWLWVDTNCIDKTSSAELTEEINSMFAYYQKSEVCFAYLADVPTSSKDRELLFSQIRASHWFTRGWTLQELIAPRHLVFYAADWSRIGKKEGSLADLIASITNIDTMYLSGKRNISRVSVSKRMSWLANRKTTKPEDIAYCMLGIFGINMTPIYGEGKRAFFRLQEKIIKTCNDHTIFCWEWTDDVPKDWASLLAPWPTVYKGSGEYEQLNSDEISVFSMTNAGLSIRLPVITAFGASHITSSSWFVMLQAAPAASATLKHLEVACLSVMGRRVGDFLYVTRLSYPPQPMTISRAYAASFKTESLIVMDRLSYPSKPMHLSRAGESLVMNRFTPGRGSRKMKSSTDGSDDNTVTFIPIFDSPRLQGRWDFHDLYGSDISPRSLLSAITLTTDADNIGVAAISITRAGRNPDPEFYILLGVEKREDSCYATAKLVEAREGDLAWDSEGLEKTMTQWRQRVTAGRSAISGAYYNKSLELTIVLGRSTDAIRSTRNYYFLCFYEGDVAYNVARMARGSL
ncbi:Heterokaryon incompatibility [Fusarium oxysporum f. sp. vasinfectum]|uniref:Heterokaryon incompatibility domain-containing protein n=1 Tax=Fusarium oxysporum f. sp. vasinfectum 25433 TaxID=1089449 RepID=X0LF09_FUSOX|nr:hypothetical protein FOTG_12285 [Fusarium oxysporum f. sp. vasinfectum 25433]KAK2680685.1 Heterokaryon incompatibility [Fusarium oxysporum f. sp. vasinfectum]KAK2934881.1 Heterokaryon incompatibility [Fusarium oxysporum f. sp. vasinfectum]